MAATFSEAHQFKYLVCFTSLSNFIRKIGSTSQVSKRGTYFPIGTAHIKLRYKNTVIRAKARLI